MSPAKQFARMLGAQLKMTFREKQSWFWGIFFPIMLMVVFMLIFGNGSDSEFKAKLALVDEQPNPASQAMAGQILAIPVFEVETGGTVDRAQAEEWVKEKKVDAAVILPATEGPGTIQLIVNKEQERNEKIQAISGILDKFVQQANLMVAGVTPTYELAYASISAGNDDLTYQDFLLTGMIALSIAQSGLFGMVDMVDMRRKGLLRRLRMTPARMGLFGISDMTMRLLFSVIQIVLLSLIGVFGFGATLHIDILSLVIVFLLGALSFIAMGYMFSSFSKTMEAYMGYANIASFLMMFLSGIFFPVDLMPGWLQPVSKVLPLTYFADGLRESMLYASGILSGSFWQAVAIMVAWGLVTFIIGSLLYRRKSIAAAR